jgi:hypothetical protein
MKTQLTANQVSGRATGALIFTGFGALWLVAGFFCREDLTVQAGAGIALVTTGLALAAWNLIRRARLLERVPEDPATMRAFHWVNGGQWVVAFVVELVLAWLHLSAYGITAIAVIVGLHLFPLARIFRYPLHYVTGTAMVVWATVMAITQQEHLQSMTAWGTGAILWISAAGTIMVALNAARQAALSQGLAARAS